MVFPPARRSCGRSTAQAQSPLIQLDQDAINTGNITRSFVRSLLRLVSCGVQDPGLLPTTCHVCVGNWDMCHFPLKPDRLYNMYLHHIVWIPIYSTPPRPPPVNVWERALFACCSPVMMQGATPHSTPASTIELVQQSRALRPGLPDPHPLPPHFIQPGSQHLHMQLS